MIDLLSKWVPFGKIGGVLLVLLAIAALAFGAARSIENMVDDARQSAIAERDNHWKAQIAASNEKLARMRADNLQATLRIQTEAAAQVREVEQKLADVERQNADLPDDGRCGLSRDRVRLLNGQ